MAAFNFNLNNNNYNIYSRGLNSLEQQKKKVSNTEKDENGANSNLAFNNKVEENDIWKYLAAGSMDMIPMSKEQKTTGIEKYDSTVEKLKKDGYEESITDFMNNFEANYDEIFEMLGNEFDEYGISDENKEALAQGVLDKIYSNE